MKPLAIDLFCGLGGWTDGLLAAGYHVVGFDIERHQYGEHCYPAQLVIQDVTTLHGSQFRNAALIVASPPCQEYSYMAMPWTKAKDKAAAIHTDTSGKMRAALTRLFDACFRIQREACQAAGRHIPLVVENVRGAQEWVGRAAWNYGSYYVWGDVPALMPIARWLPAMKAGVTHRADGSTNFHGYKSHGLNSSDQSKRGQDFTRTAGKQHTDGVRGVGPKYDQLTGNGAHGMARWTNPAEGRKGAGSGAARFDGNLCQMPSKSLRRKEASALIAKIPFPLAYHIASVWYPVARAD